MIVLVLVFLAVLPLPGWIGALPWLFGLLQSRPYDQYENAIRAAAVKTPAAAMTLARLDASAPETQVIKYGFVPTAGASPVKGGQIKTEIFVALPDELKQRCKGAADPRTALQQLLGLPPSTSLKPAYLLKVPTKNIFRPCLSTDAIDVASCSAYPPGPDKLSADGTRHEHYDYVAGLLMKSYHLGFTSEGAPSTGYPYDGYPFTGMGYTYNWESDANGHFGVSEFVVEGGTTISEVSEVDLKAFCAPSP
jgi:hypothetical protein